MVEIKMVAAMALGRFRVSLDADASAIAEHFTFTMGPDRLPMRFVERDARAT
jgi:hypothetical protein